MPSCDQDVIDFENLVEQFKKLNDRDDEDAKKERMELFIQISSDFYREKWNHENVIITDRLDYMI